MALLDGNVDDSLLDGDDNPPAEEEDPELEAIKARVKEMEEEAEKLKEMQGEVDQMLNTPPNKAASSTAAATFPTLEEKQEMDTRSIYVGNVDYSSTAKELGQHFQGCGAVVRVTIMCDKFTGNPKGFAYVEFADKDSAKTAVALDESLFKGRQLKVTLKRTNLPGVSSTDRGGMRGRGRGRGFRRGGGGGYFFPAFGGFMPMMFGSRGGRGRAMRGRGRSNWYAPY